VQVAEESGLRSAALVPIMAEDEVLAVLEFFDDRPGSDGRRFLDLVSTVGVQLGALMHRKQTEEALRESEERYRFLADNSTDMIWRNTPAGTYVYVSPACRQLLGFEPEEMVGRSAYEFFHPEDWPAVINAHSFVLDASATATLTHRLRRKDGTYSWFESTIRTVRDPQTTAIIEIQAASRDITERRAAERRLREAEAKYRALVEQIPAVLYVDLLDGQDSTVYVSPQVEGLLGLSPEEFQRPGAWSGRIIPEDRERALTEYREGRDRGLPFSFEYRLAAADGRILWVREHAVILRDAAGVPAMVQGLIADVTDLKRAEETLRTALDRERDAADRLRALDRMKDTFLSSASHELKTPITICRGHLEVLSAEPDPQELHQTVDVVVDELSRMGRIVEDITTLVRAEDPQFLRPEPIPLDRLIPEVAAKAGPLLGHRLRVESPPKGSLVNADRHRLTQALLNLLDNAARHTPGDTVVMFRLVEEAAALRFEVEDTGGGLPAGEEETLFQPFQRADPTVPGTGLGLAIVRGIAAAHDGTAGVDNRPGTGATFWVRLPR
jgi:PAS domain S-box-containing protein